MLRITANKSASAAVKYFDEGLSKSDYYTEKNQVVGKWGGKTASYFGIKGEVSRTEFEKLAHNKNPVTGEQLTARNSSYRRVGYDFTFSVPKSVSIVYSQTKDRDILKSFETAIDETMSEIEQNAATRVRAKGKNENRFTENLIWGTFTHEEARPVGGIPDPHLHQHVFVFNATYDQVEKRFKAAQFGDIKSDAAYYETVFNARLADKLQEAGYQIERNEKDFELKGFKRKTIEKFSMRTNEINRKAKELGISLPEDKSKLGAKTRESKRTGLEQSEIHAYWRAQLSNEERELVHSAKGAPSSSGGGSTFTNSKGRNKRQNQGFAIEKKKEEVFGPREAVDYALDHALERKSVVSEKELMTLALKRGIGKVSPEGVREELYSRQNLLSKADKKQRITIFTTQEAIQEEQKLRDTARNGKGKFEPINPGYQIQNEQLTQEQGGAVRHVLSSKDFITVVAGGAGTGKTWSIKEVAEGVREQGIAFGAFAPSSAASRQVQREDGFENATTIAELLQSRKLQESVKNGVIWLDEAGMVGNKTMNKVIEVARRQNARLLLTGDIKQHGAVERGDALRIIQQFGGIKPATISKIQRQKNAHYRNAVKAISDGHIEKGYHALEKMGAIKEADDFNQARTNIANEYTASVKAKEKVLIVATTHAQGKAVTDNIRENLKAEGLIEGKEKSYRVQKNLSFTDAQKRDAANYAAGMAVQFHQNVKGGIQRGHKYYVKGKDKEGNVLIALDGKKEALRLPVHEASKFSVYQTEEIGLAKGDQIRVTQNGFSNERKRLNNGNILSVKGFDRKGNIIASTGRSKMVLDKDFGNFTHGYYTTSPASQGKSVNRVIIMQSSLTGKAASKEQFYVSASRGKFAISIHTDDKESLLRNIQRSSQRMTASELQKSAEQTESAMKEKLKKIGSIYRSAKSKVANFNEKWLDKKNRIISILSQPPKPVKHAPVRTK